MITSAAIVFAAGYAIYISLFGAVTLDYQDYAGALPGIALYFVWTNQLIVNGESILE